jgi:hypothetical protein
MKHHDVAHLSHARSPDPKETGGLGFVKGMPNMTESSAKRASMRVSKIVQAERQAVYRAFLTLMP